VREERRICHASTKQGRSAARSALVAFVLLAKASAALAQAQVDPDFDKVNELASGGHELDAEAAQVEDDVVQRLASACRMLRETPTRCWAESPTSCRWTSSYRAARPIRSPSWTGCFGSSEGCGEAGLR
jgi:hypothetical protein